MKQAGFAAGTVLGAGGLMQMLTASVAAMPTTVAAPVITLQAGGDALAAAKALIGASTAQVSTWDGPTDGPPAQKDKFVVYPSQDQRCFDAADVGTLPHIGPEGRAPGGAGTVPKRLPRCSDPGSGHRSRPGHRRGWRSYGQPYDPPSPYTC